MVLGIHEHTLCTKALLLVAEFILFLWDWCGRLDDLEEKHQVQFGAQCHVAEEVKPAPHREKRPQNPAIDQERH